MKLLPLLLLPCLSFAGELSGDNLKLTGNYGATTIRNSRNVEIVDAKFSGPVRIENCRNVTVKNSEFDALWSDADACIVIGDGKDTQWYPWDWNRTKEFSVDKLIKGKPVSANPLWHWSQLPGTDIWYGEQADKGSSDIRFENCTFRNAQRAGLFVAHSARITVEGCLSENTRDYGLGVEWCHSVQFRGNKGSIGVHWGMTSFLIEDNTLTNLWVYSEGLPVKGGVVRNNKADTAYFSQGVYGNWWLPAWFEDVEITGNTFGRLFMAANNQPNVPPVFIPTFKASGNTVTGTAYLQSVRLIGSNNFAQVNTWTPKGGVKAEVIQ